ncbi:T9SS type A sorting domain-containing protein [Hymenobacter sp. RP-2-7]|uniref:T9SS type A sorting domain-containing protein n=1 Tax=Hymenobacter polaris TaxID=2682546 RepID=A0A7Y0AE05_9BACT|nr:T9SS type A sorting domain-containing protein [Hymenobacter polaris]NML65614.1 T9SS type A sorting domain-containing protein [Hymenobacter polaris]
MSKLCTYILLSLVTILSFKPAKAQVLAPTLGGEVGIKAITATTMELEFGMRGTGQGRVVAIAAIPSGAPTPLAAADSTFYTANPVYGQGSAIGQGFIVYAGTGHSVTVTNLTPSTIYYITCAEFNTDGTHIRYNNRGSSIATSTRVASATALASAASFARGIEVYPNPSAGQTVNLQLLGYANELVTVRLASALGQALWEQALTPVASNYQTPLLLPASLAPGTYFLTLANSSGQIQKRLTISK